MLHSQQRKFDICQVSRIIDRLDGWLNDEFAVNFVRLDEVL